MRTLAPEMLPPSTLRDLARELRILVNRYETQADQMERVLAAHERIRLGRKKAAATRRSNLEKRNRQIMMMYRRGHSDREIGERFGLHKKHVNRIIRQMLAG